MSQVRIIGIGSPFANDTVGWRVAEQLKQPPLLATLPADQIEVIALDRPGLNLIPLFQGADFVILIDAVQSDLNHGQIVKLNPNDIITYSTSLSSHGFEVAGTLALAEKLGELPKNLTIYGVAIDVAQATPLDETAIKAACLTVIEDLNNYFTQQVCV